MFTPRHTETARHRLGTCLICATTSLPAIGYEATPRQAGLAAYWDLAGPEAAVGFAYHKYLIQAPLSTPAVEPAPRPPSVSPAPAGGIPKPPSRLVTRARV